MRLKHDIDYPQLSNIYLWFNTRGDLRRVSNNYKKFNDINILFY